MDKAKSIQQVSVSDIDFSRLPDEMGQFFANEDIFTVINGDIRHSPVLKAGEIYQIIEPRIFLVMEGRGDICVNLQDYHLEKGSVIMLGADAILELRAVSTDARVAGIVFRQAIEIAEEIILDVTPAESDRLLRMLYLIRELIHTTTYSQRTLQSLCRAMISYVQDLKEAASVTVKGEGSTYTQELFLRFKRLVRQHCTHQRSIPFYADLLHVTPHHLSALIKKISNQSVMYWIHRATIQKAKLLLKTNQLMAYEIADRLDFPSASAFSKYFKRETGMTPRMYQERMAEGARQLGEIWS